MQERIMRIEETGHNDEAGGGMVYGGNGLMGMAMNGNFFKEWVKLEKRIGRIESIILLFTYEVWGRTGGQ